MTFHVYKITNNNNEKMYYGYTRKTIEERFYEHISENRGRYLSKCVRKYGKENFFIESLYEFDNIHEAQTTEIYLIALHRTNMCRYPDGNGMNMTDGGEGSTGYKHTHISKQKLSLIFRGKKNPQYGKRGEASANYGKKRSKKQIKHYSDSKIGNKNPQYGKIRAEEHVRKIAQSHKKRIAQYSLDNIFIRYFDSMIDVEIELGIFGSNIHKVCNGKGKSAGGFIWRYA